MKKPFQTFCRISIWYPLICLVASANGDVNLVEYCSLWVMGTVNSWRLKSIWPKSHQIDSIFWGALLWIIWYSTFSFLSSWTLINIIHLDVSNHCQYPHAMISLQFYDPMYGLLFHSIWHRPIDCNWWSFDLAVYL